MKKLEHYILPENLNRLYNEEASSAIGLCRDLAAKYNELVDNFNEFSQTDLAWKQGQEGTIRKAILYMKDNLVNTINDIVNIVSVYEILNEEAKAIIINRSEDLQKQINSLASGTPLVVFDIEEMTDTSRIYVATSNGMWYSHMGGLGWVAHGTYQATGIADNGVTSDKRTVVGDYGYLFSEKGDIIVNLDTKQITLNGSHVLIFRNRIITVEAKTFSIPTDNPYMLYFDIENRDFRWHRPSDATYQANENCVYLGYISIADGSYTQIQTPKYYVLQGGKKTTYTNGTRIKPTRQADLLSGTVEIDTANKSVSFENAVYSLGYRYVTITSNITYTEVNAARIKYVVYDETENVVRVYENRNTENQDEILLFAFYAGKLYHTYVNREHYRINGKMVTGGGSTESLLMNGTGSFIGDSITRGAGSVPFTHELMVLSGLDIENYGEDGSCVAETTASTAPSFVSRINQYTFGDVIGIMGGTNDYWKNVPLGTIEDGTTSTFYGALNALANHFLSYSPSSFLFFMTPIQGYRSQARIAEGYAAFPYPKNSLGLSLDDYCEAIRKVCAKYSIPCLDLQRVSGMTPTIESQDNLFYLDGVHPNGTGSGQIAKIVYNFLKCNYR